MSETLPTVTLKPRRALPFFAGHPWVFSGAIREEPADVEPGSVVEVRSSKGELVGRGFYNSASKIRVRLITRGADESIDDGLFARRIEAAVALRRDTLRLSNRTDACRLINSEGDGLPGLIVDQYDRWLVAQVVARGMEAWRERLFEIVCDAAGCPNLYERTPPSIAEMEGLTPRTGVMKGDEPPDLIEVRENGVRFLVDVRAGHKTGFYLDQRDNRLLLADLMRDADVLDCFSYTGGFGLYAAALGKARSVRCIDSSERTVRLARRNVEINGCSAIEAEQGDVLACLVELHRQQATFDVVVVDPPKFAKSRGGLRRALARYRRVNEAALRAVRPSGLLLTFSCSQHVSGDELLRVLTAAGSAARRTVQVLHSLTQAPDHPFHAACHETLYLKGFLCRVQ